MVTRTCEYYTDVRLQTEIPQQSPHPLRGIKSKKKKKKIDFGKKCTTTIPIIQTSIILI